jgi:hypothetical protein
LVLGLIQPLKEMSIRNISEGKSGRCVGLTTLPPSCVLKSVTLNLLEPSWPVQACDGIALTLGAVTPSLLPAKESAAESVFRLCRQFILLFLI